MDNKIPIVLTDEDLDNLPDDQRESWKGYYFKMAYEIVNPESAEIGEFEDNGWENERSENYNTLQDVLYTLKDHCWIEWSSSMRDPNNWLISDADTDFRTCNETRYSLWIHRIDERPLSDAEIDYIEKVFCIS